MAGKRTLIKQNLKANLKNETISHSYNIKLKENNKSSFSFF